MRKNFLFLGALLCTGLSSVAQNTFPSFGNAGIGTTSPTEALQIASGNLLLPYYGGGSSGNLYFGGKTDLSVNGIRLTYTASSPMAYFDVRSTGTNSGLSFRVDASNGGTERMRITNGGSIGVGTSSPLAKFHVHNGAIRLTGTVTGMGGPMIIWGNGSSSPDNGQWALEYTTSGNPGLNFWRPWPTFNNGNYFLFLSDSGRVGIKTNNPTAEFTVNGKTLIGDPATVTLPGPYGLYVQNGILTSLVHVAAVNSASWADYVFDKNYKLLPLSEVEKFINEEKHLPEVPSACEVEEKGIDLVNMDATLLKKIEELTLYIIEIKKENEVLSGRLDELQKNKK